jgi:hypothetical protein
MDAGVCGRKCANCRYFAYKCATFRTFLQRWIASLGHLFDEYRPALGAHLIEWRP